MSQMLIKNNIVAIISIYICSGLEYICINITYMNNSNLNDNYGHGKIKNVYAKQ